MPLYEYRCPTCATTFEKLRAIGAADEPARCPAGHDGGQRALSVFAVGRGTTVIKAASTGGCCGGGCGCASRSS